jgi:hypothetical protein
VEQHIDAFEGTLQLAEVQVGILRGYSAAPNRRSRSRATTTMQANSGNLANCGISFVDLPSSVGYFQPRAPSLSGGVQRGADISLAAVIRRADHDTVTRPLLHGEAYMG